MCGTGVAGYTPSTTLAAHILRTGVMPWQDWHARRMRRRRTRKVATTPREPTVARGEGVQAARQLPGRRGRALLLAAASQRGTPRNSRAARLPETLKSGRCNVLS
ncbi:unnamed protein product [Prorocentrum cordatum]|uniref:Uncharacterized protein n=1 Tax=Prorocentrum cordatum TaxID=2364126 RepID=A0ABN9WGH8_9DINO|nr:unnamed protein product [Polarella glacialis]